MVDQGDLFNPKNHNLNYDELVEQVIEEINDLPVGDQMIRPRFFNLWEEVAYQVQVEGSHCSRVCEIDFVALCQRLVKELPDNLVRQLWLSLVPGDKWCFSNNYSESDVKSKKPGIEEMRESVSEELLTRVWKAATEYDLPVTAVDDDSFMIDFEDEMTGKRWPELNYEDYANMVIDEIRLAYVPPCKNAWEEYMAVRDAVELNCYRFVESRTKSTMQRLWKETDVARSWGDMENEPDIVTVQEAVVETLLQEIDYLAKYRTFLESDDNDDDDYEVDDEIKDVELEDDDFLDVWFDEEGNAVTNNKFELNNRDDIAIQQAISVIRLFLSQSKLSARQVIALGKAMYAIERLPEITIGTCCVYGICYRVGNEQHNRTRCVYFLISDTELSIITKASVEDQYSGSDGTTVTLWKTDVGGTAKRILGREIFKLEDTIREYLNLGAEIMIKDLSGEIDMSGE